MWPHHIMFQCNNPYIQSPCVRQCVVIATVNQWCGDVWLHTTSYICLEIRLMAVLPFRHEYSRATLWCVHHATLFAYCGVIIYVVRSIVDGKRKFDMARQIIHQSAMQYWSAISFTGPPVAVQFERLERLYDLPNSRVDWPHSTPRGSHIVVVVVVPLYGTTAHGRQSINWK
jgi:hypothetical protein